MIDSIEHRCSCGATAMWKGYWNAIEKAAAEWLRQHEACHLPSKYPRDPWNDPLEDPDSQFERRRRELKEQDA